MGLLAISCAASGIPMRKEEQMLMLKDFSSSPSRAADPELALVGAALFVEQTFGIELSDADICAGNLGSAAVLERFVLARTGKR